MTIVLDKSFCVLPESHDLILCTLNWCELNICLWVLLLSKFGGTALLLKRELSFLKVTRFYLDSVVIDLQMAPLRCYFVQIRWSWPLLLYFIVSYNSAKSYDLNVMTPPAYLVQSEPAPLDLHTAQIWISWDLYRKTIAAF